MTTGPFEADRCGAPAPRLPGRQLPWLGPARAFQRDPIALLRGARERAGNTFTFPLLGQDVVFTSGPDAQAAVFEADEAILSPREAYRFMTPVFGRGVAYDAAPDEMDAQIGHLRPALGSRQLDQYANVMEDEVRARLARWPRSGEIDLITELNRMTVSIATRCLIGEEFHQRMGPELPRLYYELESGIRLAGVLNARVPIPPFRRRDRARTAIARAIADVIVERRSRSPGPHPAEGRDMLAALLAARTPGGTPLPDGIVIGTLISMIFAGQHTSTVLATWTGVLLLGNSEYVPELLAEQQEVCGQDPRLSTRTLHRMELLERCVREAERLHPPLVLLMRKALRDTTLDGYRVPAGALVMISPAVSHRMAEVFREPDRFDPSRYADDRSEHRHPYSLIGFGGGKHRCIGQAFAYLQVKSIWSVLLREVDLKPAKSNYRPDYSTFIPGPAAPCTVRYRKRTTPGSERQ